MAGRGGAAGGADCVPASARWRLRASAGPARLRASADRARLRASYDRARRPSGARDCARATRARSDITPPRPRCTAHALSALHGDDGAGGLEATSSGYAGRTATSTRRCPARHRADDPAARAGDDARRGAAGQARPARPAHAACRDRETRLAPASAAGREARGAPTAARERPASRRRSRQRARRRRHGG